MFRLVDRLDDLVHKGKALPLTNQVRLDREEAYTLLDELRLGIAKLAEGRDSGS